MSALQLGLPQMDSMRAHVESCLPLEGCGLLAGTDRRVEQVLPIKNVAGSPVRFRMDPREQLEAFNRMDANHWELLAIYHSHPEGPPVPSATDIAEAAYATVYIIWSRVRNLWQAKGFWIEQGQTSEVQLYVAAGS